jgi:hypothetical protein
MMPRFFRRVYKTAPATRAGFRPSLDPLEDRSLPSVGGTAPPLTPPPSALPVGPTRPEATNFAPSRAVSTAPDKPLTVPVNSPPMTLDLNELFANTGGVDPTLAPGLSFKLISNDNPDLVSARLSDGDLTLTFAAGKTGTAKITLSATDAAGATVRLTLVVTVGAAPAAGPSRAG